MTGPYDLPGYDAWKTQSPPEQEEHCTDCAHLHGVICMNPQSEFYHRPMGDLDYCESIEVADPKDDEPQDLDERRDRDES
jgi:hypothetical protein